MTKKPSISSISAQKVRFLSILPHPKPSFMIVNNPNNNLNTEKVEIELLNNIYNLHNMRIKNLLKPIS